MLLLFLLPLVFSYKVTFKSFIQKKKYENPFNEDILQVLDAMHRSGLHIHKLLSYSNVENLQGFYSENSLNIHQEKQKKLDLLSDKIIRSNVCGIESLGSIFSEEDDNIVKMKKDHKLIFCYDPLDGSSNIDTHMPTGTIFSCYNDGHYFQENKQVINSQGSLVLSGYLLYSSSLHFVFYYEKSVYHFMYDDLYKDFILIHDNIKIPKKGNQYSINEGKINSFHKNHKLYLEKCKKENYSSRYHGCLVADFHNVIMNGGIFMYPKDIVKNKSKIRLLYEAKPLAKIIEEMGGICVDEEIHIHKKKIKDIHETTPIYFGSNENMVDFIEFCRKN